MKRLKGHVKRLSALSVAIVAIGSAGQASAIALDVGNPDIQLRWDNNLRYNVGWRAQKQDKALAKHFSQQVSNNRFDRGDIVTNRFDLVSELDFVYKRRMGARVSAQAWYDNAYKNGKVKGLEEWAQAGIPETFPGGHQTSTVDRYYEGVSGEILDAFVFGSFDIGGTEANIKLGRHNLYWGESLFSFVHGVSYAQGPVDIRKATATPGTEAKELFLPLNQLSLQGQLTDRLSLAGYYQFEWDSNRLPEGGTYFGGADFLFGRGAVTPVGVRYMGDEHKPKNSGSWGVSARWRPDFLGGTLGAYYREFSDTMANPVLAFEGGAPAYAYNKYAEDVKLYGLSFSRLIGSTSLGAELVRRENTALSSVALSPDFARGDTWHGLVNIVSTWGKNPLWDFSTLQAELTYSRLDKVTKNGEYYNDNRNCTDRRGGRGDATDGCATRDNLAVQISFVPTWYQVFEGIDLTAPMTYGTGIHGTSPIANGGSEGTGSFSVGVGLDYLGQYKVDLAYNGFFGPVKTLYSPVVDTKIMETGTGVLRDRGWVSLTFKTTI